MNRHGLTNTGSMWVLHFQPHRLQGIQLNYFNSQNNMLSGIGHIIVGGGMTGRAYLGLFLLVAEQGTTVSRYIWCQICTDPTKNYHSMYLFTVLCYFMK